MKRIVIISKKLFKNWNCIFPVVHYFTLTLKSVSYILARAVHGALITSNLKCADLCFDQQYLNVLCLLKTFTFARNVFASWLHPETFRYKPLRLRCLPVIFLLSVMLISSSKIWFFFYHFPYNTVFEFTILLFLFNLT